MRNIRFRPLLSIITSVIIFGSTRECTYVYPYSDCIYLKENEATEHFGRRCFCYNSGTVIKWRDVWSTFQVHVRNNDDVNIVFPMETNNCYEPESFVAVWRCLVEHYWLSSAKCERSLHIPLVDETVCFTVKSAKSNAQYTLNVTGKRLNRTYFGLFMCGIFLLYFAGAICRSILLYFIAGVSLGMLSIIVFLLFVLKTFIPKRFFLLLFVAGFSLTYLGIQQLLTNWDQAVSLYFNELLGYLLVSSFVSFAVCYKHGPITDERTLRLMTWALQAIAMGMIYCGITYPPAAYTTMAALVVLKCIPYAWRFLMGTRRLTARLLGSVLGPFQHRPPQVRLLTEEEYREQGEAHTKASLKELREHCSKAGFPAWDTVLKLRSPQRFAEFLQGSSHVTPGESQVHDFHYGPGGAFFEDMIFRSGQRVDPGLERAGSQLAAGDGDNEEELDYYEPSPPPPHPAQSALPQFSAPAAPPPAYSLPVYSYPSGPYIAHPEATVMEELF